MVHGKAGADDRLADAFFFGCGHAPCPLNGDARARTPLGRAVRPCQNLAPRESPTRPSTSRLRKAHWQARDSASIPPVGQKIKSGKGAAREARYLAPPAGSAGKNLIALKPRSRSAKASDAVAAPGRKGTGDRTASSRRRGLIPGLTRNPAPAPVAATIRAA